MEATLLFILPCSYTFPPQCCHGLVKQGAGRSCTHTSLHVHIHCDSYQVLILVFKVACLFGVGNFVVVNLYKGLFKIDEIISMNAPQNTLIFTFYPSKNPRASRSLNGLWNATTPPKNPAKHCSSSTEIWNDAPAGFHRQLCCWSAMRLFARHIPLPPFVSSI